MSNDGPRMSAQTMKVLAALMEVAGGELSGAEIGKAANLQSGTLYPLLMRLEDRGWLASRWEVEDPKTLGRPRRRFYCLTGLGRTRTTATFSELRTSLGKLLWA